MPACTGIKVDLPDRHKKKQTKKKQNMPLTTTPRLNQKSGPTRQFVPSKLQMFIFFFFQKLVKTGTAAVARNVREVKF